MSVSCATKILPCNVYSLKNVTTHSHTRSGSHSLAETRSLVSVDLASLLWRYTIYYTESDSRCTLLIPIPLVLVVPPVNACLTPHPRVTQRTIGEGEIGEDSCSFNSWPLVSCRRYTNLARVNYSPSFNTDANYSSQSLCHLV